ncbi:hypothetical protein [Sphingomonas sp. 1P08PE]|uniref:hypothetical protein n=1 Tax=Sphingomonas sp. 1P08PE TaxID=554122 RepID=UPI00399F7C7C
MSQLATPSRTYQRSTTTGGAPGKGAGPVRVAVNVTGAGALYARVRRASDSSVVQAPWRVTASAPVANGPIDVTGVEARTGRLLLDLGGSATGPWQAGTVAFYMGDIAMIRGQSLAVRMGYNQQDTASIESLGVTVNPENGAVIGTGEINTNGAWIQPTTGSNVLNAAAAADLINRHAAMSGVACGLAFSVNGATSIDQWQPGGTFANQTIDLLNAVGNRIAAHWWYQGHSDVGKTYLDIRAKLELADKVVLDNVTGPAPSRFYTSVPNINSATYGPEPMRATGRGVYEDYAKESGGTYIPLHNIDTLATEGIHATQIGAIYQGYSFLRAMGGARFGLVGLGGGVLGTPTVSGATVFVPVTLPAGATTLTAVGDPKSRFMVRERSTNAALTINSLTVGATGITIQLAAAPASGRVEISPFLTSGDDGRQNMIYVDLAGDGIPINRPLTVPARPILSRPKINLTAESSTAVTYAAGRFAQGRRQGNLTSPLNTVPSIYGGCSVECWLTPVSVATTGLQVPMFVPGGYEYWTSDGATIGYNGGGTTVPLVVGQHYHLVLFIHPGGQRYTVFVNGVPILSTNAGATPEMQGSARFGHFIDNNPYTGGVISEAAIFHAPTRYRKNNFAPPTAAYVGNEEGLLHLWHLNGDLTDSCTLNV